MPFKPYLFYDIWVDELPDDLSDVDNSDCLRDMEMVE